MRTPTPPAHAKTARAARWLIVKDLCDVIIEPVVGGSLWVTRHLTFVLAAAALLIVGLLVQQGLDETERVDRQLLQLGYELEDTDQVRENLALLDAAQATYAKAKTHENRQERDRTVMQLYISLRALRRSLGDGPAQDRQWSEVMQLVTARIDACLDDPSGQASGRWGAAYVTANRLFDAVQRIEHQQLEQLRRRQAMRSSVIRAHAIRLGIVLGGSCCLLVVGEAVAGWRARRLQAR
jgi:hypothetical protein